MRREQGDKFFVRLKEVVTWQRGGIGPLETFKNEILQRSGWIDVGLKENQFEHLPGFEVLMACAKKFPADRGFNSEVFTKFTRQSRRRDFVGFHFSAGEFPLQCVRIVAPPLAYQNLGVAENQRRDHNKLGFPRLLRCEPRCGDVHIVYEKSGFGLSILISSSWMAFCST